MGPLWTTGAVRVRDLQIFRFLSFSLIRLSSQLWREEDLTEVKSDPAPLGVGLDQPTFPLQSWSRWCTAALLAPVTHGTDGK